MTDCSRFTAVFLLLFAMVLLPVDSVGAREANFHGTRAAVMSDSPVSRATTASAALPMWTIRNPGDVAGSEGANGDEFGDKLAASADWLAVGAPEDGIPFASRGSISLYRRIGGQWTFAQKLIAPPAAPYAGFGESFAIENGTLVAGVSGNVPSAGVAYVYRFDGTRWTLRQEIQDDSDQLAGFGIGVSLRGDVMVIGSYRRAYVYRFQNDNWVRTQRLLTDDPDALFGVSSAISEDAIVVGATARALLFERQGDSWQFAQQLTPAIDTPNSTFGQWIGVSGGDVLIRSISQGVYVFRQSGGSFQEVQKITSPQTLAIRAFSAAVEGDLLAVGEIGDAGSQVLVDVVRTYRRTLGVWQPAMELRHSDNRVFSQFGVAVAIADGTVVGGARHQPVANALTVGAAVVFEPQGNNWTEGQTLNTGIGNAYEQMGSALAIDGDTAVLGLPNDVLPDRGGTGSVLVLQRSSGGWTVVQKVTAADGARGDAFGRAVRLSAGRLLVGASGRNSTGLRDAGAVYAFERVNGLFVERQTVLPASPQADAFFGFQIAAQGDWMLVSAVALPRVVIVLKLDGTTWQQRQTFEGQVNLRTPSGFHDDRFGVTVAIAGDLFAVGAPGSIVANGSGEAVNQGLVYLYRRDGADWVFQRTLTPANGDEYDFFGAAVVLDQRLLVVGAPLTEIPMRVPDGSSVHYGVVHVYDRSGDEVQASRLVVSDSPQENDEFGASLGLTDRSLLIGRNPSPSIQVSEVLVYDRAQQGAWLPTQRIEQPGVTSNFDFGAEIETSRTEAIIGAPLTSWRDEFANFQAGAAYILEMPLFGDGFEG